METSLSPAQPLSRRRLYGLDALKFGFIVTIVIFHVWENLVYQDLMERPFAESYYSLYGKVLSLPFHYAGPFLAGLSFFLFGYRRSQFSLVKWVALVIGVLLIQSTAETLEAVRSIQSWSWDVYSYLVLLYGLVYLIPKNLKAQTLSLLVCILGLLFSPQFYSEHLAASLGEWKSIFVMDLSAKTPNGWFLLPWIFLPVLMFNLGNLVRSFEPKLEKIKAWELPVFLLSFTALDLMTEPVAFLAGARFYEFLFWQKTAYFWMHFLWFLFYIRLQFSRKIQNFFDLKIFRLISKLNWVKHLWFCYLFHFLVLQLVEGFYAQHSSTPYILDFIALFTFLSTELIAKGAFLFFHHSKRQKSAL